MTTIFPARRFWGIAVFVTLAASLSAADSSSAGVRPVTFAKDIAPIFQERCQECHRNGSMAPMSLVTYEETRPWAKAIRQRVITRQMPPWHIDKTVGVQKFKNDMSLTDEQIDTVVRWVDAGAPLGRSERHAARRSSGRADNEWKAAKELGQPDLVIKSEPYTMAAHHQDVWWRPTIGYSGRPSRAGCARSRCGPEPRRDARSRIMRSLIWCRTIRTASLRAAMPTWARAMLMEWAIGKGYDLYRPDTGKLLLPGAQISWDVHIHAVGEEIRDNVELGIWLYPKGQEPKHRTYLTAFQALARYQSSDGLADRAGRISISRRIRSPKSHNFTVLKQAAQLENFQPHMHLRGKAMAVEAILPDGTTQMVSYVGNFNFNWMTNYIYADDAAPVFPKGTMIHVTAWYDNTTANPNNPDPDQWVGFGDRTVDEMGHAWMNVTYISDEEYNAWAAKHKQAFRRLTLSARIAAGVQMNGVSLSCVLIASACSAWGQSLPLEPAHETGASITGAFEGWFKNPDGSFSLLLGYYNRNQRAGSGYSDRAQQPHRTGRAGSRPADSFHARPRLGYVHA